MMAGHSLLRLAQIRRDLLALHHAGAAFGELRLLTLLRIELLQLIGGVAQIIGIAGGALHIDAMGLQRRIGGLAGLPEGLQRGDVLVQPSESVEQPAMRGGIHEGALIVLAMDLDQSGADRLHGLHGDRLIVDEGTGAAVGELHAAQNHLAGIVVETVVLENRQCWMAPGQIEHGCHLALFGAVAHQAGIAAATEGQRKGIEKNRFAGAGFTGQHCKTAGKLDIEPFDQDNVTDRQTGQHERSVPNRGQIS